MSPCDRLRDLGPDLVRDRPDDLPADLREHLPGCPACQALAEGAASLRADLDLWEAPAPDDLVERTLARLAMAGAAPQRGAEPAAPRQRRRRTSIELLTSGPLMEGLPAAAPPPRRLLLRLFAQAAAAAALFAVCTGFVVAYYPAVAQALEDRRVRRCQERLRTLQAAALRYRHERPDAPTLRGAELRKALIEGGYADLSSFVCPGHRGEALQERSYFGELPPGGEALTVGQPLFWDRFGNHGEGFNVVYADGRLEIVTVDALASWYRRTQQKPRAPEGE